MKRLFAAPLKMLAVAALVAGLAACTAADDAGPAGVERVLYGELLRQAEARLGDAADPVLVHPRTMVLYDSGVPTEGQAPHHFSPEDSRVIRDLATTTPGFAPCAIDEQGICRVEGRGSVIEFSEVDLGEANTATVWVRLVEREPGSFDVRYFLARFTKQGEQWRLASFELRGAETGT